VLLQKTLLYIEGLGRQLYPELDLWTTAKPFMERWMQEQVGPKAFSRKLRENLPKLTEHAADMPILAHKVLLDAAEGRLELKLRSDQIEQLQRQLQRNHRNTASVISGGAMLISGSMLLTLGPSILLPATLITTAGAFLGLTGAYILLRSWFRG
jgi:ubiquinone biosynthesis protein